VLVHDGLKHLIPASPDELLLPCGEVLLFAGKGRKFLQVIDGPHILLERDRTLRILSLHPDLQVEQLFLHRSKGFCIDPLPVFPREAVKRHLHHRVLRQVLLCDPGDDLIGNIPRVHSLAFDRAEIDHRGMREVEVPDGMPPGIHEQPALGIRDLAIREILGRSRIPGIVRDLALAVVVPECNVIELIREDRAVQFVLRDGRQPLVLDRGRKPVGHQHIVITGRSQFDLVKGRAVILHPEHIGDEVEDRIPDLNLLVPEFVGRCYFRRMIREDFVG